MLKQEIHNYKSYLQYKRRLEERLEDLWYELTGVKGIRYDSVHVNYNPSLSEERRLSLLDKVDYVEGEMQRIDLQIRFVEAVLERLNEEDRKLIDFVLIDNHTQKEASAKWYLTESAISKRIDTILFKALETTFKH